MRFIFFIALRYLLAKKRHKAINYISYVSLAGITVATAAMIAIMSAFNGLQHLVESLYSSFDPDIKVAIRHGKTFPYDSSLVNKILAIDGVIKCYPVLEETVLLKNGDKQTVATMKGVPEEFKQVSGIDSFMVYGDFLLQFQNIQYCVAGYGVAAGINLFESFGQKPVYIYAANPDHKTSQINPADAFRVEPVELAGIFGINPDYDNKYVLVSLSFARNITGFENRCTHLEVDILDENKAEEIKSAIEKITGDNYSVKTRYELNEIIYRTNETEKLITFVILSFIVMIAAFNIVSAISMIMIDKTVDLKILNALGASLPSLHKIFFTSGMIINITGFVIGSLLGIALVLAQQYLGLIPLENGIVDYYPVKFVPFDLVKTFMVVVIMGLLANYFPSIFLVRKILSTPTKS